MERKFAGSDFATKLLRQARTIVHGRDAKMKVYVDHQPSLYRGTQANRTAYIFPSTETTSYLSMTRRPDFAYCLARDIFDSDTDHVLRADNETNHFPCLSATFKSILPFATGEVKVAGNPYKQRFQQAFYASYYIISSLILRILERGAADNWDSADELLTGVQHYGFSISPHSLQIWEYKPYFVPRYGDIRISARMLCNGAAGDQVFMEDAYIPWCRFVLKQGMVDQQLRLLPAIRSYAARPHPRPFNHPDTVFLKINDLRPGEYNLGSSSFGNGPSQEQTRLLELVKPYEDAVKAASERGSLKRKSSQNASTSTSMRDSFAEMENSQEFY